VRLELMGRRFNLEQRQRFPQFLALDVGCGPVDKERKVT
jgi:hypothetical protein